MSTKRKTTKQFIEEAIKIHGNKYDYSKVEYVNQLTKVCIICPKHGEFWQMPKQHLRGRGCPQCGFETMVKKAKSPKKQSIRKKIRREHNFNRYSVPKGIKTTDDFIRQAKIIHGDKYDYSKTEYNGKDEFVTIICPIHGEFQQKAVYHLMGRGCIKCGRDANRLKQRYTNEEFIKMLKEIYGDEYDYSKVNYKGSQYKITLICPKHGEFERIANELINKKRGCPHCIQEKKKNLFSLGKELFIKKSNNIFHGFYEYNEVEYVNNTTKVKITCPKHGIFMCTPANHLRGRGCPICKSESYVYEERLYNFLKTIFDEKEIIKQYRVKWLTNNKSLDFFIPKYNIGIEHQGSQHYYKTRYLSDNDDKLEKRIENDKIKYQECNDNGVHLLYFSYEINKKPNNCFHELIFDENKLKETIIQLIKKIKENE